MFKIKLQDILFFWRMLRGLACVLCTFFEPSPVGQGLFVVYLGSGVDDWCLEHGQILCQIAPGAAWMELSSAEFVGRTEAQDPPLVGGGPAFCFSRWCFTNKSDFPAVQCFNA